jgi:hypothetical protein
MAIRRQRHQLVNPKLVSFSQATSRSSNRYDRSEESSSTESIDFDMSSDMRISCRPPLIQLSLQDDSFRSLARPQSHGDGTYLSQLLRTYVASKEIAAAQRLLRQRRAIDSSSNSNDNTSTAIAPVARTKVEYFPSDPWVLASIHKFDEDMKAMLDGVDTRRGWLE